MWRGAQEGGRQVRVVRVALHRPVERHSSRDRAWATKSRWGRWEVGRDSFRAFKSGFARSATLGLPRKSVPSGNGGYWGGQFTPRGTTYVFVNVVVAPRYVARLRLGSGGLSYGAHHRVCGDHCPTSGHSGPRTPVNDLKK